jgi:oligosaccharyltransferase complex subunit alpha (ribophorin I)
MSEVIREVDISHWSDSIGWEEGYSLRHAGASLTGPFSRDTDFSSEVKLASSSPCFQHLSASLPISATNIYYGLDLQYNVDALIFLSHIYNMPVSDDVCCVLGSDQLGNISTSTLEPLRNSLRLNVSTRFPLCGGWKTQFYIGFSFLSSPPLSNSCVASSSLDVPPHYVVDGTSGIHTLTLSDFILFRGEESLWVDDLVTTVILPEGATHILVASAHATEVSNTSR